MKKNNQPLVSVVIPVYNGEEVIADAIDSILGQTYRNIEVIIIDDVSKDGTWDIVQKYKMLDSRIQAYRNTHNLGIGGNRARGIELARGDFICWQDADDISMPDRISQQLQCLIDNPDIGVVGGYLEFFGRGITPSVRKYAPDDASLRRTIFRYNPIAQPASMFRKECFSVVGSYDPSYLLSEDLEMFFRLGTRYKFANVQKTVIRYRQDASSLTHANLRKMELATLSIRREYFRNEAYNPSLVDYIYNVLQLISIFLIPSKLKVALFTKLRNSAA